LGDALQQFAEEVMPKFQDPTKIAAE